MCEDKNHETCIADWWQWVKIHIHQPIRGYEAKYRATGKPYNLEQQKKATHTQIYWLICDMCRRGKSPSSIKAMLTAFSY